MTVLQVLYLIEVAQSGSMSRAAEALFMSQPALSLQIRRLEEEVGCRLFERSSQGVRLTEEGRAFYEDALPVAQSWQQLLSRVKQLGQRGRSICMGIGPRALSNGLFEDTVSFFEQHPEIEVTFVMDLDVEPLDALKKKKIDIALDRVPPPQMFESPEHFTVIELLRERQCILLAPDDPRAALPELHFDELDGAAVVAGPEGSLDDSIMRMLCKRYDVNLARVHRADSINAVMTLIKSGKGFALGPPSFVDRYQVAAVPMVPFAEIGLNLICLRQNRRDPLVQQLESYLKGQIAGRRGEQGAQL
ncbi:MAG: LysR family transcriptional regulator [Clostridia bacterium]|nr:LysR family transcriptional regulator [Clostridia bacterium]